jgi:D-alanyl-D-alanine carboxypeptidase
MIHKAIVAVAMAMLALATLGATPSSSFEAGSVHVDRYGNGSPALVLVPGLTDSATVWSTTVARYQATHTIYVLTLPGFGGRPPVAAPMLDTVDRDIAAFLASANKPVIIGHSLGGFLAIRLAEEHSDLIRGAIAIDGLPVFPGLDKVSAAQRSGIAAAVGGKIGQESPADFESGQTEQMQYMTKPANLPAALGFSKSANIAATGTYLQEMMSADLRPNLSKVSVPLLEIGPFEADVDPANPYNPMPTLPQKQAYYQSLFAGDPTAKVVMIDDSRHFIMLDQPTKLFAAIDAFLHTGMSSTNTVTSNTLFASEIARRLDQSIATIARRNNLPSVAVGVFVPGRGRYTFVEGYANLQTRTPRSLDQPFRIASVTKAFAATAVLVLVDRGLLRKTDLIAKWYPSFPNANRITIDDLLRMRSGIPAPNDDEVLARVYDAPLAPAPSLDDELASYAKLKREFKPPNTIGVYTDFNYDILAGIVERVTGKDIGDLIDQMVIEPLKLRNTSYPVGTAIAGPLRGYGWNPATKRFDDKTLFNPPLAGAAGAVVSNISDLATFARVLCIGGLLKPQTQRERQSGLRLQGTDADYGEGVATGSGFCGHSGTINGYSTDMYYVRKFDASFVISVNRLDRDNRSRTTPILALISKAILSSLPAR